MDASRKLRTRRIRVGLAVGPRRVVAVTVRGAPGRRRPERVHRRELERGPGSDGWPELREALEDLRETLSEGGRRPLRVDVALLPALARTKVVELPSAGREACRRLASREVARHFLDPPADPVADAAPLVPSPLARGPRRCVTACAGESDVRALLTAVEQAGAEAGLVVPGAWALAEGAVALRPAVRRGERRLRLDAPGARREILLREGSLRGVRPAPPAGADPAHPTSAEVASAVEPAAAGPDGPEVDGEGEALDPVALAAFGSLVAPEDGPALLPEESWRARRRRGRVRAAALAAGAVLLVAAGAMLHLWGLDREIRAVEERRSAVADAVERAAATREAARRLREVLSAVDAARPRGASWVRLLSEVGRRLPSSAHLEALERAEEGVRVVGSARSPSALVPRLEGSPLVESARLESAARAEAGDGGESFRILLSLARPPGRAAGDPSPGPAASGASGDRPAAGGGS